MNSKIWVFIAIILGLLASLISWLLGLRKGRKQGAEEVKQAIKDVQAEHKEVLSLLRKEKAEQISGLLKIIERLRNKMQDFTSVVPMSGNEKYLFKVAIQMDKIEVFRQEISSLPQ